jgi:hypothetical protein
VPSAFGTAQTCLNRQLGLVQFPDWYRIKMEKDVPCIWIEETHFGFPLLEPFFDLDLPRPLPLVLDAMGMSDI